MSSADDKRRYGHLNYFYPYDINRKGADYEEPLSRAFMTLVRIVPSVRSLLMDLVRARQFEKGCDAKFIVPPFSKLERKPVDVHIEHTTIDQDEGRLISVLISNEHYKAKHIVKASKRDARYDGYIGYPTGYVFIIENKPDVKNVRKSQLDPSIKKDTNIEIYPQYVDITWKDVIDGISMLQESGILSAAENSLIDDFYFYVSDKFQELNPYNKLGRCLDNRRLLRKRCTDILESVAAEGVIKMDGNQPYIHMPYRVAQRVMFSAQKEEGEEWCCWLGIWPADTVTQAKWLYKRFTKNPALISKLLELRNEDYGWTVRPNLHFCYIGTELHSVADESPLDIGDYIDFWLSGRAKVGQVKRPEFKNLFDTLRKSRLVREYDIKQLDKHFTKTKRDHINPCPGIAMFYTWDKQEAIRLDDRGELAKAVREKITEALEAIGVEYGDFLSN